MPPRKRFVKTSFYADAADLAELRRISERTMIPISRLLRTAIKHVLKEYASK
jgi:hypothetical protein